MRDVRVPGAERFGSAWILVVAALVSWLVVQNVVLLLMWSWPVLPALLSVGRALLKVLGILAIQLLPAVLLVGGVAMLWWAARRPSSESRTRFNEVHHG